MKYLIIMIILLGFPVPVLTQDFPRRAAGSDTASHHEVPDDSFVPQDKVLLRRSPAKRFSGPGTFTVQVNVDPNGNNILGDAANEPSIAIDQAHPERIVMGWRQFDNVNSNFRQAGYGYSTNGGQTWTFPGVIEPAIFRSDPVLESDAGGTVYYNSLTSNSGVYTCKVFKSTDGGATWDAGTDAHGGDKQWMTIDRTTGPGKGNVYSFWTSYYSSCEPGYFTRSDDSGGSFEPCIDIDGSPYWGTMAVGAEGELYVSGTSSSYDVVVSKSSTAKFPGSTVFWDFSSPVDLDGYLAFQPEVNPAGLMGQVYIGADQSNGPGRGNVYVLASVARYSNGDPADVMFSRSTDGGVTWSLPLRINTDESTVNYQWFGTMSVAPDGRIDVIWLDTRDDLPGSLFSSLYYCYSNDQGITWSANTRLSESFDPHAGWPQQAKMGDYFDMKSDEEGAHLAWANTLNDEQDVYYTRITPEIVAVPEHLAHADPVAISVYPNPVKERAVVQFTLPSECHVTITLMDLSGREVAVLTDTKKMRGTHSMQLPVEHVHSGYYTLKLRAGDQMATCKVVKL